MTMENSDSTVKNAQLLQLKESYVKAGQGHVFTFWDELNEIEKAQLAAQLQEIDVHKLDQLFAKAMNCKKEGESVSEIEPLPDSVFDSTIEASAERLEEWRLRGLQAIANGEVGVILMAGGQGTRLGSNQPKGCYDIGLPSQKSLFQLQAERILRVQEWAQEYLCRQQKSNANIPIPQIPWFIMTSTATRVATEEHFRKHNNFGLAPGQIIYFNQENLPAFSPEGKVILADKHQVSTSPNGNGGLYKAVKQEGILDRIRERTKVKYIHSYCVDNCLVRVADPVFMGYCIAKGCECGVKVVRKRIANESVGVVCFRDGKYGVVEYTELSEELKNRRRGSGKDGRSMQLAFGTANIANHFFTVDFLDRITQDESFLDQQLQYHVARKKIKHIDLHTAQKISPKEPNGIKLELFIFDIFPLVGDKMAVLEVNRDDEFSPLKNAPGSDADCPETSRRDLISQQIRFVENAGGRVDLKGMSIDEVLFEISPLVSYEGEALEPFVKGKVLCVPLIVESREQLS